MNHRATVTAVLLLSLAFLIAPSAAWAEDLDISPTSHDFGEVEIGDSAVQTFHLTSLGPTALWVYVIEVSTDGTIHSFCGVDVECDFAITRISDTLPLEMYRGDTLEVDVTYTPTSEGETSAFLYVHSNDSIGLPGMQAYLPISGTGVVAPPPPPDDPAELMDALLEAFDAYADTGDIWGIGPGRSARHRLEAFRALLLAASWFVDARADGFACIALAAARAKADGERPPPDFIDGDDDAMADLLASLDAVVDALGCWDHHHGCRH